ncbi:CrcB family protein, partial [Myxococcota bacterium]|nr:CrcB family protein [Myxococcota bacterium]
LVTQGDMPKALQLGVATGFLGAFTTFSTFSVETVRFIHDGNMNGAAMNVGANLIFGIAAAIVGWWLATVVMA